MEILKTKRLRLRNFYTEEAQELLNFYHDPNIGKYMYWGKINSADIKYLIEHSSSRTPLDNGAYAYAVSFLKSNRLVGEIYLEKHATEFLLGYAIKPDRQGHGYATEILKALLKYLDKSFPDMNVIAIVDKNNLKSQALLKKLGFVNDIYQFDASPFVMYSLYGQIH